MGIDELQEAKTADVFWRSLRWYAIVAYLLAGIAVAFRPDTPAVPYLLAFLTLMAAAGTIYITGRIRAILAPYRDAVTGELPFERPRLRLAEVVGLRSLD